MASLWVRSRAPLGYRHTTTWTVPALSGFQFCGQPPTPAVPVKPAAQCADSTLRGTECAGGLSASPRPKLQLVRAHSLHCCGSTNFWRNSNRHWGLTGVTREPPVRAAINTLNPIHINPSFINTSHLQVRCQAGCFHFCGSPHSCYTVFSTALIPISVRL